jgi:hypothetical protein
LLILDLAVAQMQQPSGTNDHAFLLSDFRIVDLNRLPQHHWVWRSASRGDQQR